MKIGQLSVILGLTLGVIVIPASPAAADFGLRTSMTMPSAVAVGQTGRQGSFTVTNTNTAPNGSESNTVSQLRLVPSCGTTSTSTDLCSFPDPGVFSVNPTATGRAGTSCAGRVFDVSTSSNGAVVFTARVGALVLPPPSGTVGANVCTVDFTFSVLKVPTMDTDPTQAGVQTRANLLVTVAASNSGLVLNSRPSVQITVVRANPTLATQASQSTAARTISDRATLTGLPGAPRPTGTVTFTAFGPDNATCTGAPTFSSTNSVVSGVATSNAFPVTRPGTYRFVASYSGDANYVAATSPCNAPNESVVVAPFPTREAVADFDGNGRTDVAVFRPSSATWLVQSPPSTVQWGQPGDIPVPGDYDGNGITEHAVYRPASGTWYLRGPNPRTVVWGIAGDIPVPADYDGNGTTDIAIFRPSNGVWFVQSPYSAVQWGQAGDVPVPGDYDGNGRAEQAVYRPSSGTWYLRSTTPMSVRWGSVGDIPVPGDYDGNGRTEIAVFRPSNGVWFGQSPSFAVQWGQAGDVPVPGDYDGNGTTEQAVYRPSNRTWYLRSTTPVTTVWGSAGDIPLPLPAAIYRAYF